MTQKAEHFKQFPCFSIRKEPKELPRIFAIFPEKNHVITLANNDLNRNSAVLPTHIIAYSSGMNELLSNPFIKMDFQYYEKMRNKDGSFAEAKFNVNRLFSLNYSSNKFITICNFLFDADDFDRSEFKSKSVKATDFGFINLNKLKDELKISALKSFTLTFKLTKIKDHADYLPMGLNTALADLKACATFVNQSEHELKNTKELTLELVYWINSATRKAFSEKFKSAFELFRHLYFFDLLNNELITADLRKKVANAKSDSYENLSDELPKFEVSKKLFNVGNIVFAKKSGEKIHYRKLSDGEHQLIHVFGALLLIDSPGALFLLDEPETHFNPDWRSKFVDFVNSSIDDARTQEVILTTHSPYIVSDCKRENVFIFNRKESGQIEKPETPRINTFGTSVDIISDEVFNKESSISELSKKYLNDLKSWPMSTLEEIGKIKEASRAVGESVEKLLLFKELIMREKELKE